LPVTIALRDLSTAHSGLINFQAVNSTPAIKDEAFALNPGFQWWDAGHEQSDIDFIGYTNGNLGVMAALSAGCLSAFNNNGNGGACPSDVPASFLPGLGAKFDLGSASNPWSNLFLSGSTSGTLAIHAAPISGTSSITFPAGTTNFTATGGTSQVVKQASSGAPLTVGQLACSDLSNASTTCTVNVIDFGADPTGVADSTTAVSNAIAALPAGGGDVFFPCPKALVSTGCVYSVSNISIGNGSASAASTVSGIRLVGPGLPATPQWFTGFSSTPVVKIKSNGVLHSTLVSINGPVHGWGLSNLAFDCNSLADLGIFLKSGQYGEVSNVTVDGCLLWGLKTGITAASGVTNPLVLGNSFRNFSVRVPSGATGGIVLTGTSTANALFNTFVNTTVSMIGTSSNGLYLQAAAGNTFIGTEISGASGNQSVVFDYGLNSTWPANNTFLGIEPQTAGTTFTNSGTPSATAGPNYLYGLINTDGAAYPNLQNLITEASVYGSSINATPQTANYAMTASDGSVIFNCAATCTLTLPAAASFAGRVVRVKTLAAQLVNSASSNVKPIGTNTAGTAILAATAGKWAELQSDGSNWVIMEAN
jgi:hypothetical protein